jgi:hypothetical protein
MWVSDESDVALDNRGQWCRSEVAMARKPTPDEVLHAQGHVVGLLNEVEAVLSGWVLGYDRDGLKKLTDPLYDMCDTDDVPARRGA